MEPTLAARVLVVLGLLSGPSLHDTPRVGKLCPCQLDSAKYLPKDSLPDDTFFTGTVMSISCCKDILLGYHDPGASIQWSFNDETFSEEWASSFRPDFCGNETLKTMSGRVTDQGNYSCTITATNATSKTFIMKMTMEGKPMYREKPKITKSPSNIKALLGDRVSFTFESYVGTNDTSGDDDTKVTWIKVFPNNTKSFAKILPNVNITKVSGSGRSWGTLKGQLVISSVQRIHFGIYKCIVKNYYGGVLLNMSLLEGISEEQATKVWYQTMVVVAASVLGLLLLLLLGWCRWRRRLLLYCRRGSPSLADHQYDVFLIHGESASSWVWSILLPALEDSFGYTCFLPQRDMHGGEMVAESIIEALGKCRRTVVVITPCLLNSPWATWATYSGIQTVLTSKTRILALVHKEQTSMNGPLDQNPLLSVLKVVRKIKVPEKLAWEISEKQSPQQQTLVTSTEKTESQKVELKLIIPEINVSTSLSSSLPKSQRLSNMISGSNTASREDLESKDKTTEVGVPVVFTDEDQGPQDPDSPNSVTPFILPCNRQPLRPHSNGSVCQSLAWCLQIVCMGNPEEQFWDTLRLHIGPPSNSNPKDSDE